MSLTQEQIKHIARLAKLQLSEGDVEKYGKDLNSIVGYIDVLNSIPEDALRDIDPNNIPGLIPRHDEESQYIDPDALLACSPKKIVNHQIAIENIMS